MAGNDKGDYMGLSSDDRVQRTLGSKPFKRRWLRTGFAAVLSMATLLAVVPAASATDTMPWGGQYADTAHPEQAAGPNQPYQHGYTGLDIMNWNPAADKDSQYLRSRVPMQARIAANSATQKNPNLPADTEMFNLAGDYGNAFFESFQDDNVFSQYLFNYWQYTDYYGTWHGMPTQDMSKTLYDEKAQSDWTQKWFEFGTLNLPNAAYTNAAHKNGAKSIATIFFSDSDRGEQTYRDLLQGKRDDGTYPIADKLVKIAKYYGFDGYFVNQESDVDAADVESYRDFMKQIVDNGVYVQWYDSAIYSDGNVMYQNMFNEKNSPWVQDPQKGKISDSVFLNYWYSGSMLKDSAEHAESLGTNPKTTVFAGIEAGKEKFDTIAGNAQKMSVNLNGSNDPYVSIAALGSDFVSHELGDDKKVYPQYQNQVFDRERRLWTGSSTGNKGSADISDGYIDDGTSDDGWQGFSSQIAERSVVKGPVFSTSFNTGHGLEWRDGGAQTSDQQWGNINLQDVLPTWQWWIDADSDPLQADFDYGKDYAAAPRFQYQKVGAYEGGNSLVLSGKLSSDNTIRLYKTDLDLTGGSKVNLTYNKPSSDDSQLKLGLIFADDTSTMVPVDVSDGTATDGWKTVGVDLSQYAGRKIATLGLIVKAGAKPIDGYQANIGKITLTDGLDHTPAAPQNFAVERAYSGTKEVTAKWDIADYDNTKNYLLYLDDTFLGGRYDDNLYVKNLPAKTGTLKLYAVGADGSRSLASEIPLNETSGVLDLQAKPSKDGSIAVSWKNPPAAGAKTVVVQSDTGSWRYAAHPFSKTVTVAADQTSVTIADVPVDGSRYTVSMANAGGATVTEAGTFADATIEPYPACNVSWNEAGDQVTLTRPQTQDWRFLHMSEKWKENGEDKERQLGAKYTYSQETPPTTGIIRGRTEASSYTLSIPAGHELWVQVEDYNGNKTKSVKIPSKDDIPSCTTPDSSQPDVKKSTLSVVDGEAVADGAATRVVNALVKDSYGNPIPDSEVSFDLPDGVTAANDSPLAVKTGDSGIASLSIVSSKAGEFVVNARIGGAEIGKGVTVRFKAVSINRSKLQAAVDAAKQLKESGYTADSWKQLSDALQSADAVLADGNATQQQVDDASNKLRDAIGALKENEPKKDDPGKEEPKKGERLSDTGSTVVGVFVLAVLMAVAGIGVSWLNRHRSRQ
jgi:endo-beta-N-acetylglucosaminidase D